MNINRILSPVEAKKIIDTEKDIVILDVRTQKEFEEKHIPDATLLPLNLLQENLHKLIPCKDTKVLIYCLSGKRSLEALNILISEGYNNSYSFGGIKDWPFEIVI